MAIGEVKAKRWNRDEYYRLAEAGLLEGKRAELIQGEIFMMSPHGPRHAMAMALLTEKLNNIVLKNAHLRVQSPISLGIVSEPEPDFAIIAGTPRDYPEGHPTSAQLVIEVSETSLQHDRETKSSLYAEAGIQEFWLVDLIARQVEVRTQLRESGYQELQTYQSGDSITPLISPETQIAVADILP